MGYAPREVREREEAALQHPVFHEGAWWQQQPDGTWWWWNAGSQRWEMWQAPAQPAPAPQAAAQPAPAPQAPVQPAASGPSPQGASAARSPTEESTTHGPAASVAEGITRADALHDRVQSMLMEMFGRIEMVNEGIFTFPVGSARLFIRPLQVSDDITAVNIYAVTNLDVPSSSDVFRLVATHADASLFGHLLAIEEGGSVTVVLAHRLLGNFLDKMEFEAAVQVVAEAADEIDDEVKEKCGGRTFHESPDEALKESAGAATRGGYL